MEKTLKKDFSGKLRKIAGRLLKVVLLTVVAAVLFVYGTVVCLVTVLSPERLTPLVCNVANKMLDADVRIGRVELFAKSTYPFLRLEVDSLSVVTPNITALKSDTSLCLPSYADSLVSIDHFVGELRLPSLLRGNIDINNIDINGAGLNLVIVNDSVNNFDIVRPSDEKDDAEGGSTLRLALHRFSINGAREFRFYDAITRSRVGVMIEAMIKRDGERPCYALTFTGDVAGDMLKVYNLLHLPVTLDGDVEWDSAMPRRIAFDDFSLGVAGVNFKFNTTVDFGEELIVRRFDGRADDLVVGDLLSMVPDSISESYGLRELDTDARLNVALRLDREFNLDRDSVPYATAAVDIAPCHIRYGKARIERLSGLAEVQTRGNNLDSMTLKISDFALSGPATSLNINGEVSEVMTDPNFKVGLVGFTSLSKLPPPLLKFVDGYISGNVKTDIEVNGRQSMLSSEKFHLLTVDGDVDLSRFYWLASDTANMVYVNDACLKFGTKMRFNQSGDLLAATFRTDSANVLSGGIDVTVKDLSLGIAAQNMSPTRDTTVVIPMGGGLKFSSLNVVSITDSAGARFRDVNGRVVMRRYQGQARVPEFDFDLGIKRMAAGSRDARFLFSDSRLRFGAHKLPTRKSVLAMRKSIDSIRRVHPDLSPDSVMALAIAKRRGHRNAHRRVYAELTDSATEIIDWGTSKAIGKLLLDWSITGSLSAERARLFTPHFPLRNRLDGLNITFNNDSIQLNRIAYKAGRSDFFAEGRISNIRRALTTRRIMSPLKVELNATSDTVDVNQIAEGFFRGASYSQLHDTDTDLSLVDSDRLFEQSLDRDLSQTADTMAPVLIPSNVEVDIKLKADNILYSDLLLHNMTGNILVYDGALNLHEFKAASDVGSVDLSALYSAPSKDEMRFGFGLDVDGFDIAKFVDLVPAIDSIMPLLRDISGIIDADIAATVDIAPDMNFELPTLTAAIKLQGDSLQLLDAETFRTIAKWLMFKDKQRNIIDHMNVEMIISDNQMQLFPFIFDIDRYKIGVQGHNDLALNFNYLISVLKSPLPFKFGITLKGNPDDYKIRLGRAKFDEKQAVERTMIVDTARVNLIDQIENVFRRGVRRSRFATLNIPSAAGASAADINLESDPVTPQDSLIFIREGLIPAPATENSTEKDKK